MDILSFYGKTVCVETDDGQIFKGLVSTYETAADSDDGLNSIDLVDTKQFPHDILSLNEHEIKTITELD